MTQTAARLTTGDRAPAFALPDSEGATHTLDSFAGRKTVLYFYPAASTPACTQQACDFNDTLGSLAAAGYRVVGLSPDTPEKLKAFARNQDLGFTLLADEDHAVALAYGAWGEKKNYGRTYEGLIRSTIVVDEHGVVELAQYNVRAKGHVAKLHRDLGLASA
ncbi:thioredoxin-dependent thiol peroxidase [Zafaria sp. J156]|uniref:thioredoxin-dependent thiol peroxidase n=1 Tax=Zafaria sp. J156 TaxID=3116490 RepID=UPI002E7833FC|nr:thioredoxin-dependent thiol peroxidase [Zafaria sp. J156]MEE1620788.1 thioredoxin-dependent thiol peroxidase [Zafaria sp. J156]